MNAHFIFATCQVGTGPLIKQEVGRDYPGWRLAFSRPGFLTFKLQESIPLTEDVVLPSVLARSSGLCLGKVTGETVSQLAAAIWKRVDGEPFDQLHVWQRDPVKPGLRGFEPHISDEALAARDELRKQAPCDRAELVGVDVGQAKRGDRVLDCILVDADQWWVGCHQVSRRIQRWPGGIWTGDRPPEMVARSYLKMAEALDWTCWPMKPGQRCVDLGCAPGGTSQALLDHGLRVVGVDPAVVDPRVVAHQEFHHVRKRS
ncbi:MAG: hypothetical protein N2C12_11830, partial [Planctomycetales bacterium]